jgi:uracil-DNA glycosylase
MERESRRLKYLEAMGIPVWLPRFPAAAGGEPGGLYPEAQQEGTETVPAPGAPCAQVSEPAVSAGSWPIADATLREVPDTPMDWEALAGCVSACTACPLHRTRTQTVFGVGNRSASLMVIGEAPGEQEDLKGEPFVGRAGQLLNEMLRALGLSRQQVYIANILKCRPPGNRDPAAEEVGCCESFLQRQVSLVRPAVILAVGRIAAQNLLKTTTQIGKLRGNVHRYQTIPLIVTYHPAYLLRSPGEKRKAWDDLRLAARTLREEKR